MNILSRKSALSDGVMKVYLCALALSLLSDRRSITFSFWS